LVGAELVARVRQDFPELPLLHIDDIARRGRVAPLMVEIPTIYKPFSIATVREAVRKLLAEP
jgi:hypothetical protein